jgi:hypothetical protein
VLATWDIRVRRFGACEIALEGQKGESNKAFEDTRPTLRRKARGEMSMAGKRRRRKMCKTPLRKSCAQGEACIG